MVRKLVSIAFILCSVHFAAAQESLTYQKPSKEILDLVDFERSPSVYTDSKKQNMVFIYRNTYKTLDDLNQDELRLAGLRINPTTNISSTATYFNNIKLKKLTGNTITQVTGLPANAKLQYMRFSPDDRYFSFTNTTATGVELWVIEIATAQAKKIAEARLNANIGWPYTWLDENNLLVKFLPSNRPAIIDGSKAIPSGPTVQTADGSKAQNRTYQDLLKNKTDEDNFENIASSEIYKITTSGSASLWKKSDIYTGISVSPDKKHVLVTTVHKPFSYLVQYSRFPGKQIVYDNNGNLIKEVNDIPLSEVLPKGFMAVRKGKRSMAWRDDKGASLYYAEALDSGDPEQKAEYRDELFSWDAPFDKPAVSLLKLQQRFSDITWGSKELAIASDYWWNTRNMKTYAFNPSNSAQKPAIIFDRDEQDKYNDPGTFQTTKNEFNRDVLKLSGTQAFLIGEGHTEKGQFPFIDQYNFSNQSKKRIYQSAYTDKKETLIEILDYDKQELLVQLESKNEYPNYYLKNLKKRIAPIALTHFENPFKSIENVHKEVIKYKRKDGVELSATLYLPVGYDIKKKEKLPMIMWAYPQEFKDKNSASQNTSNPNEFTFPFYGSPIYWVTKGYVVLDDAAFPILGEGDHEPNDTFIEQLVANAEAAIDAVDKLGYIDRKKVAVGGHSYGAFMTANLLTHSDLFACGVARSGAYNRTLTPFGFQSEERNYWEAQEVYNTMSPFMSADKMNTPLLLIHGDADNNPGTFTLQSERYFAALKGLGKPARLVLLPKESHGYMAKESILHTIWEQDQWFEKYLKGK